MKGVRVMPTLSGDVVNERGMSGSGSAASSGSSWGYGRMSGPTSGGVSRSVNWNQARFAPVRAGFRGGGSKYH